jgi:uncharacterized tellurite resistance protein B-like protein
MSWLDWLNLGSARPSTGREDVDAVRRISEALDRLEPERARFVAAFAYLLGRVALADREVSPEESTEMERLVMERGGIPEEQAVLVARIARAQNLMFGGTEDFLVARQFDEMASRDQKLALLDCLYAVSAADRSISVVEDNEISRIATALHLEHADIVAARLRYQEYLSVLRKG